jgi:3-oxoadipate enol-lactonase
MWDRQMPALLGHFRVLRYDTRGHGGSSVTPGPYTNAQLADDILRLLDALGVERAHFGGLSMGGMAGMRLGVAAPERIDKLVLCSTGAKIGSAESWKARIDTVQEEGMAAVADTILGRWFTPAFAAQSPAALEPIRRMLLECSPEGYVACSEAIRDADERDAITQIRARTLVISGRHDPATPPADGHFLADRIPGARYVELPGSHLSNIECAHEFNRAVISFLQS